MHRWLGIVGLCLVAAACLAPALRLQREARAVFEEARVTEQAAMGEEKARAARCREQAAHVEALAHADYPLTTPATEAAAALMRRDCSPLNSGPPVDLGTGLSLPPDLAPVHPLVTDGGSPHG